MLYLRLARGGGVVEINDAEEAAIEGEYLILKAGDGRVIGRFPRLDVLAYSAKPDLLEDETENES